MSLWSHIKQWCTRRWPNLKGLYKPLKEVIKKKHRFVVTDTETLKVKFAFELSGIKLFVSAGIFIIALLVLNTVLIAFTPLREYIPGYANAEMVEQTYHNTQVIDSLETRVLQQEWMLDNIKNVLSGKQMPTATEAMKWSDSVAALGVTPTEYTHSRADSLLRIYVNENDNDYPTKENSTHTVSTYSEAHNKISTYSEGEHPGTSNFFPPVNGKVLTPYNSAMRRYGIDISAPSGAIVYSIYGGVVVLKANTTDGDYVIAIQHSGGIVSIYKNCDNPLPHVGDAVHAGDPIAYVSKGRKSTTSSHLYFELWIGGKNVNPCDYIIL